MRPSSRVTFTRSSYYESRSSSRPGTQETAHTRSRRQSLSFNYAAAFSEVNRLDMHTLNEASLEASKSATNTVSNSLGTVQ